MPPPPFAEGAGGEESRAAGDGCAVPCWPRAEPSASSLAGVPGAADGG